jgi:hypothetical protein
MLRIGTGGFTIVPNWALDALADAGSNALALGTLLLRLIPGQTGEIVLAGPTSRRNLCTMLQWGTENSTKFDQALAAIESTGLVSTRIENGNSKIICIHGELQRAVDTHESTSDSQERHRQDLAAAKIAPAKTKRPSSAKIAPLAQTSTCAEDIKTKNKLNKITHYRDIPSTISNDDDEWINIFSLYGQCFKSIVPKSQKDRFLSNARESGLSPEELKDRLIALSKHPLLVTEVTSINVVWHFQHLQKKAKTFDFNVREMLQDLARRHVHITSFKAAISEVLQEQQNSHLDADRFWAYFAQDIEKLLPASTDEGTGKAVGDSNYSHKEHPQQEEPTSSKKEPENKMNYYHLNKSWMECPDSTRESSSISTPRTVHDSMPFGAQKDLISRENTESIFSGLRGSAFTPNQASDVKSSSSMVEDIAKEPANSLPNQHEHDISGDNSNNSTAFVIPEVALRVQANQKMGDTSFSPRMVLSMRWTPQSQKSEPLSDPTDYIVDGLLKTHTKTELLTKINEAMERADLEQPLREILETLKDLTKASNASLSMLKTTVSRRFGFDKAS